MISGSVLGKVVEVTTLKGLKYFGRIIQVNQHRFFVTLANVKEISKRGKFYDFLVLRATDIQSLNLEEDPAIIRRGPKIPQIA